MSVENKVGDMEKVMEISEAVREIVKDMPDSLPPLFHMQRELRISYESIRNYNWQY